MAFTQFAEWTPSAATNATGEELHALFPDRSRRLPRGGRRSLARKDPPLMATLRTTLLATAMISTGLLSTTGIALANTSSDSGDHHGGHGVSRHHDEGTTVQKGLVNSSDFAPNTTGDLCNNDVPVNVLGVQVPIQDLALGLPILSAADHGNGAANAKSCSNGIDADN
jgi:hypothetical protein